MERFLQTKGAVAAKQGRILAAEVRMCLLVVETVVVEAQRRDRAVVHDLRGKWHEARLLKRRVGDYGGVAVAIGGADGRRRKVALAVLKDLRMLLKCADLVFSNENISFLNFGCLNFKNRNYCFIIYTVFYVLIFNYFYTFIFSNNNILF